jgi:hypothetical protein
MEQEWERLGHLTSKEKVQLCITMSDGGVQVCADGIKNRFPDISEEALLEKLRERIRWMKENP